MDMKNITNRGALRTHKLIRSSFLELLKERPLGKITVTDVVQRSGINRSTFYHHYSNIHGIIEEFGDELADGTLKLLRETDYEALLQDPKPILREFNRYLEEGEDVCRLFFQSGETRHYVQRLTGVVTDFFLNLESVPEQERNSMEFRLQTHFFVGGVANLYQQWLQKDLDCSSDQMLEQLEVYISWLANNRPNQA